MPDLIGYIRAQWRPDSETSSYAAVRQYIDLELLVLDELGVQTGSQNEQALLFEVIDARLSENRPTIFLSNLKPKMLAPVIGERILDRIKGKCVAQQFSGESRRKPLIADVFGGGGMTNLIFFLFRLCFELGHGISGLVLPQFQCCADVAYCRTATSESGGYSPNQWVRL